MNYKLSFLRLSWLKTAFASQRFHIGQLLDRLKDVALKAGSSLALHSKFLHLLEQVSADRDKEMEIIHEIEKIEKLHAEKRQKKLLAEAKDAPKPSMTAKLKEDEQPKRMSLLTFATLVALFKGGKSAGPKPDVK